MLMRLKLGLLFEYMNWRMRVIVFEIMRWKMRIIEYIKWKEKMKSIYENERICNQMKENRRRIRIKLDDNEEYWDKINWDEEW